MKFDLPYNEPILIRKYPPESLSYETIFDLFPADMTKAFFLKFLDPLYLARSELAKTDEDNFQILPCPSPKISCLFY
jgi:hypothetical protein